MGDPITLDPADYWRWRYVDLASRVAVAKARSELDAVTRELAEKYPDFPADGGVSVDDATCAVTRTS